MFSSRSKNITCAYCHIVGHHIRECAELANKKRNQTIRESNARANPSILPKKPCVEPKNVFSALYSSDEEEEEGEIVEERRLVLKEPEEPEEQEEAWSRSGMQGVKIAIQTKSKDVDEEYSFNEELLNERLNYLQEYVAQFKGMAWADI